MESSGFWRCWVLHGTESRSTEAGGGLRSIQPLELLGRMNTAPHALCVEDRRRPTLPAWGVRWPWGHGGGEDSREPQSRAECGLSQGGPQHGQCQGQVHKVCCPGTWLWLVPQVWYQP